MTITIPISLLSGVCLVYLCNKTHGNLHTCTTNQYSELGNLNTQKIRLPGCSSFRSLTVNTGSRSRKDELFYDTAPT